ncbi:hypothetical protein TNIN_15381 [Trichonephila inaurata madagascariensis]|uniref:Uncharacterized protein n=1 Tax=Trichonephila inaurata madagascariensis TaxID=2747483 RepID=A0A8X6M9I7_9ARAC|nr:hypothetical protein TNIN_15381 [Trichonephila inaurata madagascariensis]
MVSKIHKYTECNNLILVFLNYGKSVFIVRCVLIVHVEQLDRKILSQLILVMKLMFALHHESFSMKTNHKSYF